MSSFTTNPKPKINHPIGHTYSIFHKCVQIGAKHAGLLKCLYLRISLYTATRGGGLCPSWILAINRLSVHPFMVLIVPQLGLSSGGPASQFLSFLVKCNVTLSVVKC